VALPPDKVTGDPKSEPSTLNCTVPVRVPAPGATALTVAVKVTDWPETEVLSEEPIVFVVLALLTVCGNGDTLLSLVLKLLPPLYAAETVWPPTDSEELLSVAWPELIVTGLCGVPSMVNVTVPAGVPAPGATAVTVAVKVTDWPNTEGAADEFTVVVVSALLTVWVKFGDVLVLKLASPPYTAVIVA